MDGSIMREIREKKEMIGYVLLFLLLVAAFFLYIGNGIIAVILQKYDISPPEQSNQSGFKSFEIFPEHYQPMKVQYLNI